MIPQPYLGWLALAVSVLALAVAIRRLWRLGGRLGGRLGKPAEEEER